MPNANRLQILGRRIRLFPKVVVSSQGAHATQKNEVDVEIKSSREKLCSKYGFSTHLPTKCWILHLKLKYSNVKKSKYDSKKIKDEKNKNENFKPNFKK